MWSGRASAIRARFRSKLVVNGQAVERKEIDADGQLRDVSFNAPIEREQLDRAAHPSRRRIRTRCG